jgi:CPA1 family monovalent cation:H+ antiporter
VTSAQGFLFFLLLLGILAAVLRLFSQRAPVIPYQVILAGVILGLVPGLPLPKIGPELLLLAFVPGLVFEAALSLDLEELRRQALPVGLLATVGVFAGTLLLAMAAHYLFGLDWTGSAVLAAIVATTDPVAVVSVLRRLRVPAGLTAILEGESLFNDGTGVAVFTAVLASIAAGAFSASDASIRFLLITVGGIAVGLIVGTAAVLLLRRAQEAELEILATLVAAYGSYLLADLLHFSGVVAVVVAGLEVARFGHASGRMKGTQLLGFWGLLAFVLNAVLFVLVGSRLPTIDLIRMLPLAAGLYAAMVVVRAIPVYGLLAISDPRARNIRRSWRTLTFWGGMRGALSVALALVVAETPGIDPRVSTVAYGMVVLSLLIQGGLMGPLAHAFGLSSSVETAGGKVQLLEDRPQGQDDKEGERAHDNEYADQETREKS